MLMDAEKLEDDSVLRSDVTVVGAGAAGIVMALELARAGLEVVLVESGGPTYSQRIQSLADTEHFDPHFHAPMSECTRRQVGGTSVIWGGRVVPFDPVDFDTRDYIPHSQWPVSYQSLQPYFAKACQYLKCGRPEFEIRSIPSAKHPSIVPGLPDGDVLTSSLERWSVMSFGVEYQNELERTDRIRLVHGLTCTEIECDPSSCRVASIRAKTLSGKGVALKSRSYALACGGLNTIRLLLASDRMHKGGIGNHSGMLGRFYMGHISGRIAEVQFSTPPRETAFGFDRDAEGVYVRRRFSFSREFLHQKRLPNIAGWLVNAEISNPAHGNGILSFAHLILSSPAGKYLASDAIRKAAIKGTKGSTAAHLMNMVRDFPRTALFIPTFGYQRYFAKRKVPGFFQYSRSNTYDLHYFGEQMPNPESRVCLLDEKDELGMRKIKIDLHYSRQDVQNVIDAHRCWDAHLREHHCGQLRYVVDDLDQSIWDQAGDGFHQIGGTRMSHNPANGVVGPNGNVHGFDDLFIASSSNFVTASQANSMFTILVFALRLADFLKESAVRGSDHRMNHVP
ncbi:MAG: GMC oxidoreductase [Phycisphaerales bacterium]|nr:GMC oxidoreductase [Phycisphaerales bacterium]MCI0677116.1 GMC oxidoreductase [Phycisphaerales bacterium]